MKAVYSIFKLSPAQREDYQIVNELLESHDSKSVAYLSPQKFCGRRWLVNEKALKRAIKLHSYLKRSISYLKEEKKIPPKGDCFTTILDKMGFPLHLATLELSLFICNKIEPFLTFCQGEWLLAVFFYEKLKELLTSIMERFICPAVFAVGSSTWKMLKINLKKEEKLISSDNIHLVGTARAINKCTATQALEVKTSKQIARKFLIHLVEK